VAEVTGSDPALTGALLGSVSASLAGADPPYTPDEVREFGRKFHAICTWAAKDRRERPTPVELQNHIGKLRAGRPQAVPLRPVRVAADVESNMARPDLPMAATDPPGGPHGRPPDPHPGDPEP